MLIYIVLIIIILTGSNYLKNTNAWYRKKIYFHVVFFSMLIIVGCRDITVGKVDTQYIYAPRIVKYFSYTYEQIWNYQSKDKVFYILTKFLSNINENISFVLFFISIPFLIAVIFLIKKHSKNACLSFIAFLGLQYFTMPFFLLRQVIAMAFCIIAFEAILNKKKLLFVALVLIGSTFHQTALLFLLAYPISLFKIGVKQWLAIVFSFGLSLVARQSFVSNLFTVLNLILSDSERYSYYESANRGLGYTGFAIQLVIFICITYAYHRPTSPKNVKRIIFGRKGKLIITNPTKELESKEIVEFDEHIRIMYNFASASLALMAFSSIIAEFWRAASYFGIFNILLLPNAISSMKSAKSKNQITLIVGLGLIFYFVVFHLSNAQVIPYKFFWQ